MARTTQGAARNKTKQTKAPPAENIPAKVENPVDRALNVLARFSRFGWDVAGVLLAALGVLWLLALPGWTGGALLSPLAEISRRWMGWGAYLLPFAALVGASLMLFRQHIRPSTVTLDRVLACEMAALTLLPVLTILGGGTIERADAGLDGGITGWGLAEIPLLLGFSPLLRNILYTVLLVVFLGMGFGLFKTLLHWMDERLGEPQGKAIPQNSPVIFRPVQPALPLEAPEKAQVGAPPGPKPAQKPQKATLPPEFRKSFKIPKAEPEPAVVAQVRDERLPPLNLLTGEQASRPDERHINLTAGLIEKSLAEFGVPAKVVGFRVGPAITQFAVEPGFTEKPGPEGTTIQQKVRVSQISSLSKDLALALSAERLRIEAPVPGHSYVGIEVPNTRTSIVRLRPVLESDGFYKVDSPLAIVLGKDVSGRPVVADLARMPHLLIAGTTGSGKSVCIEALTACLAMNNTPEDLRLVMVDPKMVELVRFNGLPHLLGKVETSLERILAVLHWSVAEMDRRYKLLEAAHARDIAGYNQKMEKRHQETLPRIIVMIDELADLMMTAPDQTEPAVVRLAQMARATGIHLVVATQRPSTDVVTGLIKANFPARIAFAVASSVDSRVILDMSGAETLLGRGDMLFLNPESGTPLRAQGVMVTDQEIERIITFWQKMCPPDEAQPQAPWEAVIDHDQDNADSLVKQAIEIVCGQKRASASMLQRRLRIGYPRAARLIDELEEMGVVGPSQGGGREREVLLGPDGEGTDETEADSDLSA